MKILYSEINHTVDDVLYARIVVFSILLNVVMVLPEIVIGTIYLVSDGLNLSTIISNSRKSL